jgi:adenylate cyclase
MATETERKFLVRGDFKKHSISLINIIQGYLSVDPQKTVRIRIADDTAFLTVKGGMKTDKPGRGEWEYPIPLNDAHEMMEICLPGRVIKTRYLVPSGRHMFEVDVFHERNEGLVIAEIELSAEDEIFEKPEWLGEEVTGDPQYYNSMLIK